MPEPTSDADSPEPEPASAPASDSTGAGAAGDDDRPEVILLPDAGAVALAAARRIADALTDAVEERGRADFATTGGSAPIGIYPHLATAPLRELVPWPDVHLWWGDERFVPRDHPQSNARSADDLLMNWPARTGESGEGASGTDIDRGLEPGVWIAPDHVHPFPCTQAIAEAHGAEWCAARYTDELRAAVRIEDGWPVFDMVLLGVGPDGHVFSVFPGSPALASRQWSIAIPAPTHVEPHLPRVTLNPAVLTVARSILVVATGAAKAEVLGRIFGPERNPRLLPAQLALRSNATWVLDAAAAEALPR